ncbi:putative nuclease HARBI1-like protein [Corchorus olitorius]|uniref:Nuclease HARBI1-like protein n=1 Tax=Corchorus olitorius TaxID=93759 RepID=A0A1R3JYM5_9ROSI|nr:putative nuclease HARBI1-like protein [Corchorus olitorius]
MDVDASNSLCSNKKRARDEEKKEKIVIGIITTVIAAIVTRIRDSESLVKEPVHDWEFERKCYLNGLYNGRESDCTEQLRLSKQGFRKLCILLSEQGGLVRTKHVSICEVVS